MIYSIYKSKVFYVLNNKYQIIAKTDKCILISSLNKLRYKILILQLRTYIILIYFFILLVFFCLSIN
jgi:hypothetical protein